MTQAWRLDEYACNVFYFPFLSKLMLTDKLDLQVCERRGKTSEWSKFIFTSNSVTSGVIVGKKER